MYVIYIHHRILSIDGRSIHLNRWWNVLLWWVRVCVYVFEHNYPKGRLVQINCKFSKLCWPNCTNICGMVVIHAKSLSVFTKNGSVEIQILVRKYFYLNSVVFPLHLPHIQRYLEAIWLLVYFSDSKPRHIFLCTLLGWNNRALNDTTNCHKIVKHANCISDAKEFSNHHNKPFCLRYNIAHYHYILLCNRVHNIVYSKLSHTY